MAGLRAPRTDAGKRLVAWTESDMRPLDEFGWHEVIEAVLDIEDQAQSMRWPPDWPGRDELAAMSDAEVNDFLASRGLDVRVVEP